MRSGTNAAFSNGEADEIALYTRALGASEVQAHYDLAQDLADDPLPSRASRTSRPAEPPLAGTGLDGGVLGPGLAGAPSPAPAAPTGAAFVRRGRPDGPRGTGCAE